MTSWNPLYFSNSNDPALSLLLIFKLKLQTTNIFIMFLWELPARSPNPRSNFLNKQSVSQLIANLFLGRTIPPGCESAVSSVAADCPLLRGGRFLASWFAGRDLENVRKRVKHRDYRPKVNTVVARGIYWLSTKYHVAFYNNSKMTTWEFNS